LCIESKNGAVTYLVHVRRRGSELRRARFRYSGGTGPRFKLVQASRPLREAIRGLGPSGGGRETGWPRWLPSGGSGGSGEAPELWASSGELGVVRRRQRGRQPGTRAGFIAVARAWSRVAAGARGFAHGSALSAPPSVSPRRTRGSSLLPWFNAGFEHLSMRILAKPLCTVSFLLHILPFCCGFQVNIQSG
jgi:hypothetical protein